MRDGTAKRLYKVNGLYKKKTSCLAEILVFRMYSQVAQARTALRLLEYHLGKVYGKKYLNDE